jgi:molybdate/tungstate transport system substrate-binding protein
VHQKSVFQKIVFLFAAYILTATVAFAGSVAEGRQKVIIFHAGSLKVPMAEMEKRFENKYPGIDVVREFGGSTKMARLIAEKNKSADIMASADFAVIDKTLIPEKAAWNIRFATNQLVLCYTDRSRFGNEVNVDNWYEILQQKEVSWGHSDPNLDPCGYRSLMVLQLAEKFYKQPGLYEQLIQSRPQENVRAKAVELVAMLKNGQMDYAWEYLSVAVQNDLKYVQLSDHINLGNYKFDDYYRQAEVKVTGKKIGTWITRTGKSCTYGVTMIKDGPNPDGSLLFLQYLLDPKGGLMILKSMGQPPFVPCRVPTQQEFEMLPPELKKVIEVRQ